MRATDLLSIGDIAKRTGLSVSAIRFYEEKGLIESERNRGGQRRFLRRDIRRLSFVLIAQKFGFTIGDIKKHLDTLPNGRTPTKADWAKMSQTFRHDLNRQIDELTRLRDKLDGCIGCGCLSLQSCALYNPEDEANVLGDGPRVLLGDDLAPR